MSAEQALMDRAVRGDAEALNGLVATHRAAAYRIAVAILGEPDAAEDAAQDVVVRLTAALPGFGGAADLERWVYRVTVNRCRDHLRRRKRRSGDVPIDSAPQHPDLAAEERPDRTIDIERARAAVTEAMNGLSDDQKEVLTLRYVTGLPYAEIARVTATPQGTIASRVFRALRRLGEQLDPRHLEVLE